MKKRQEISSKRILGLITIAALFLSLYASHAIAACPSTSTIDFDSDGLTDNDECNGFIIIHDLPYLETLILPSSLNPDIKNLFVILRPAASPTPTLMAQLITEEATNPSRAPDYFIRNLNITTNKIDQTQAMRCTDQISNGDYRCVTPTQKAVRVSENLEPLLDTESGTSADILGFAPQGIPNGLDSATVWTEKIKGFVTNTCSGKICKEYYSGTTIVNDIIKRYIQNTTAHEIGHTTNLRGTKDRTVGYHYPVSTKGAGLIMEQYVYYKETTSNNTMTFYISGNYNSTDLTYVKLKN